MPLSPARAPRKLLHTRTITCHGYEREDGLWDIEAHMTDVKTYPFPNQDRGGEIKAGEPLHDMWMRLTLDQDFTIQDAEARTDWAPFNLCAEINTRYQQLIGMTIQPGWNLKIKQLFNGVAGCTHLTDLLGPMATAAVQTIHPRRQGERAPNAGASTKPRLIDSCHALRSDSEVVRQHWPRFYTSMEKQTFNQ